VNICRCRKVLNFLCVKIVVPFCGRAAGYAAGYSCTCRCRVALFTDKIPDQNIVMNVRGSCFTSLMTQPADAFNDVRQALDRVAAGMLDSGGLSDQALLDSTSELELISRQLDIVKVRLAGEVAVRSGRVLGNSGLAASRGYVNAESLIREVTGTSFQEASRRVRVGLKINESAHRDAEIRDADARDGETRDGETRVGETRDGETRDGETRVGETIARAVASTVFEPIVAAVTNGSLGVDGADRVMRTLEVVIDSVDPEVLKQAATTLAIEGAECNADRLGAMARGVRDTLHRTGVADREAKLRSRRSLRKSAVVDGLRRVSLVLDPESDAIFSGAIDAALSPRLGGPRFVDPIERERAERLVEDERTNEQLALDALVQLVRLGVESDEGAILGFNKPSVRVTIALDDLMRGVDERGHERGHGHERRVESGIDLAVVNTLEGSRDEIRDGTRAENCEASRDDKGIGWFDGCDEPISAATARRFLCEQGALPVILGGANETLELGRSRRYFSSAQRVALAVRDGGCRWPGCDRPPSWSEAHHIDMFSEGGNTNVNDGILLCRRHHMILHNNGWHISREGPDYLLRPPNNVDPARKLVPMPTKSPLKYARAAR
jgi:hypothetical protein